VGSWAAKLIAEQGAKIIAVSDVKGGIMCVKGLDISAVFAHVKKTGSVIDMPGTKPVTNEELLTLKVDIMVPAALGGSITENNARQVQAKIVVEAANSPVTTRADEILQSRNITVLPDILVNAGGVTCSYFEWVQNLQQLRWDENHVNTELEKKMVAAWTSVHRVHVEQKVPMRIAAYIVALEKVAEATRQRY
jgi:glutamate dehydrogenase/leucine dehydrogenase